MAPPRRVVAGLRGLGVQVVDLSADFRLRDLPTYERWYGPHGEPDLLEDAVYGLTELHRDRVREAELVANPGCYPTAAMLALAPLAERGADRATVVIDAKSGVSGRRARAAIDSLRRRRRELQPLRGRGPPPRARDRAGAARRSGADGAADLRPAPAAARPGARWRAATSTLRASLDADELRDALRGALRGRALRRGRRGAAGRARRARHATSAGSRVASTRAGPRARLRAIDNLWKGAAGQAIQNLNLMLGLDETEGLGVSAAAVDAFLRSRWVDAPDGRRGARPAAARARLPRRPASPAGSRAAAAPTSACSPATPSEVRSALLLTRNAAAAAPVRVCRDDCDAGAIRAVGRQLRQRQRRHRRAGRTATRWRCATPPPRPRDRAGARSRSPRPA